VAAATGGAGSSSDVMLHLLLALIVVIVMARGLRDEALQKCPVLDLVVDIMHDFSRSVVSQAQRLDLHNLKIELKSLDEQTLAGLLAEGISTEKIKVMRYLDMRYVGQWRSLTVACPRPLTVDSLDRRDYIAGFDSRHDPAIVAAVRR
jgi:N-methylhydantoinase A/oxoprolinase/acetone carboxylase beta subunit